MKKLLVLLAFCSFFECSIQAQGFGEPSAVKSIYFGGGSYFVDWEQSRDLEQFLDSIPNIHNYLISVHSHTDNVGGKEYNEWLSKLRSNAVLEIMVAHEKIEPGVIKIEDFGLFNPTNDNTTREGRRKNRRVDIIFWLALSP